MMVLIGFIFGLNQVQPENKPNPSPKPNNNMWAAQVIEIFI